jgi:hypothetical protein
MRELFYQFVEYGGEEIHKRGHFFIFLEKIISNRAKDSCISLINVCSCVLFVQTFGISVLFLVARAYVVLRFSEVWQGFHSLISVYL